MKLSLPVFAILVASLLAGCASMPAALTTPMVKSTNRMSPGRQQLYVAATSAGIRPTNLYVSQ